MRVSIASGNQLVSHYKCDDISWEMQEVHFATQQRTLQLGSYDAVLGVDWLGSLGPILFDYQQLQLQYEKQGKTITLKGIQHKSPPNTQKWWLGKLLLRVLDNKNMVY